MEELEKVLAKEFHVPAYLQIENEKGTFIGSYHMKGKQYFVYVFDRGQPVYATLERAEVNKRWLRDTNQMELFNETRRTETSE